MDVQREGRRFIATRTGSAEQSFLLLRFFCGLLRTGMSSWYFLADVDIDVALARNGQ